LEFLIANFFLFKKKDKKKVRIQKSLNVKRECTVTLSFPSGEKDFGTTI